MSPGATSASFNSHMASHLIGESHTSADKPRYAVGSIKLATRCPTHVVIRYDFCQVGTCVFPLASNSNDRHDATFRARKTRSSPRAFTAARAKMKKQPGPESKR